MKGRCGRGPEDDRVVAVGRVLQESEADKGGHRQQNDPQAKRRSLRERGRGADREERCKVEEVTVLRERLGRETQVEGCDLQREQRHEQHEQHGEGVCVLSVRTDERGHSPGEREQEGHDAAAHDHLVEMRDSRGPDSVGEHVTLEWNGVVADRCSERAERGETRSAEQSDRVDSDEHRMRGRNPPQRGSNTCAFRPGKSDLVTHDRQRQDDGHDQELCAREERERQTAERGRVVPGGRRNQCPMAEEHGPGKGGIRSVLREERRGQDEPGRHRGERTGSDSSGARSRHGSREQECGDRGAGKQQGVQQMGRACRARRAHGAEEGGDQQGIELAQRAVVGAVNRGNRREARRNAFSQPHDLELVGHHGPAGGPEREVAAEHRRPDYNPGENKFRRPGGGASDASAPPASIEAQPCFGVDERASDPRKLPGSPRTESRQQTSLTDGLRETATRP